MSVHSSLITHHIEVLPGKRLRLYGLSNGVRPRNPAQLDLNAGFSNVTMDAIATEEGWLVALGYGELPIVKIPGRYSLEEAIDYEIVNVYKKTANGLELVQSVGEM